MAAENLFFCKNKNPYDTWKSQDIILNKRGKTATVNELKQLNPQSAQLSESVTNEAFN